MRSPFTTTVDLRQTKLLPPGDSPAPTTNDCDDEPLGIADRRLDDAGGRAGVEPEAEPASPIRGRVGEILEIRPRPEGLEEADRLPDREARPDGVARADERGRFLEREMPAAPPRQ
jgi:hypothetical protein